jgi:hypothetical protein
VRKQERRAPARLSWLEQPYCMPNNVVARWGWRSGLQSPGCHFVADHSVFKKVINAFLSAGLNSLKP